MSVQIFEAARLEAQKRLDEARPHKERNRLGQFATPPSLARAIMEETARMLPSRSKVRVLDPAFGTGAFYTATLEALGQARLEGVRGVEVDDEVVRVARSLWSHLPLELTHGDFSRLELPHFEAPRADLVVCNPPYVRHHHLSKEDKARLRQEVIDRTGVVLSGLSGFYAYFLLLADAWWAADGLGVWLLPGEYLEVNYGRAVKRYLSTRTTIVRVHRFDPDDCQFDGVLVSSTVLWIRKSPPSARHKVRFTSGNDISAPEHDFRVPQRKLDPDEKWTRHFTQVEVVDDKVPRLGDLFTIRRGMATGANPFFILKRQEALEKGLPSECLTPVLPSPRHLKVDCVEGDADGHPVLDEPLVLVDCRQSPEVVESKWPALWAYFEQGAAQGLPERYLCSRREPWYTQERRDPPPLVCTYMGRSKDGKAFRFIRNRSQALATNAYLMLYPKGLLAVRLQEDPGWIDVVWEHLSQLDAASMLNQGRAYGGGLRKMEPKELRQVPVPWFETQTEKKKG